MFKMFKSDNNSKGMYYFGGVCLFISFCIMLYKVLSNFYYETDLWWYIPTMFYHLHTMPKGELIKLLILPTPVMYAIPFLKIYAVGVLAFLGPQIVNFIYVSVSIFFLCSFLLFFLVKRMGGSFQISFLSAVVFASSYVHFQAYMWPIAIQHLIIVFFILLTLNLYLITDSYVEKGVPYRKFYVLTLAVNFLATALCRINIIMLPVIIFAHILFCSKDKKGSQINYNRWLPLFVTYLFYPLFTLISVGDHKLGLPATIFSSRLSFPILFLLGVTGIFLLKGILKLCNEKNIKFVKGFFLLALIGGLCCLRCQGDILKYLMLPYAVLFPFAGSLGVFFDPIQNVLGSNSTMFYYPIYLPVSMFTAAIMAFFIVGFIKSFMRKKGLIVILFIWYILVLFRTAFSNPTDSRYFIYFTPIFSVVFSSGLIYGYSFFNPGKRFLRISKDVFLVLVIFGFCFMNISAIRLRMWRDKLGNTFCIYDYIRIANIIKEDERTVGERIVPQNTYIDNVVALPIEKWWGFSPVDSRGYYNFRLLLTQVFNNKEMMKVNINKKIPLGNKDYRIYSIEGARVNNKEGKNIDAFSRLFKEGEGEIGFNDQEAKHLLEMAIREKPFLLKYLLEGSANLTDLRWLYGDNDLRIWVNKILYRYMDGYSGDKLDSLNMLINQEIDEYVQCLFYLSYLNYLLGDIEKSEYWFSRIGFFESNYNRAIIWLREQPLVAKDKKMLSFLNNFDNSLWSFNSNWDRIGFLDFERFLLRWEI